MKKWKNILVLVFLIIITFIVWKVRHHQIKYLRVVTNASLDGIPLDVSSWIGRDTKLSDGVLTILGVDSYIMREYRSVGKEPIWLYVGYYKSQKQGSTIHSPLHCYPGSGWTPENVQEVNIPILPLGKSIRVKQFIVGKGDEREVVYYWYQERGRVVASEYLSKAYQVVDSVVQGRNDGALVRFSARTGKDTTMATVRLKEFISAMVPFLQKSIPD